MVIKITGGDGNGRLSTVGEHDHAIASGVRFWSLSNSLGDAGEILGVRKANSASPGLSFSLITDEIVDVGEDFLELISEKLSDEGSREIEDEDLEKLCT